MDILNAIEQPTTIPPPLDPFRNDNGLMTDSRPLTPPNLFQEEHGSVFSGVCNPPNQLTIFKDCLEEKLDLKKIWKKNITKKYGNPKKCTFDVENEDEECK